MKRTSIKGRIFKYNLVAIILLITLTTIIFNVAVRVYIERDILGQLKKIASGTEDTALRRGPDFFPKSGVQRPPPQSGEARPQPHPRDEQMPNPQRANDLFGFYLALDRSLREPLSVLNANYILLDSEENIINPMPDEFFNTPPELLNEIASEARKLKNSATESYLNFNISGTEYVAIIKPVSQKNTFGLGWVVIYSSLQKLNQLQLGINLILLIILLLSSLIIGILSSMAARKITAPFLSLSQHIGAIAERDFGTKIHMPVDDELQEFVNNINLMSEKLEIHDKAQKTFLQNASHEFRTPLMSIQSYAEGIKYEVVDTATAVNIIIDETKRMTRLVEDLLYLSRLDAIEENYHFSSLRFDELISACVERMNGIAIKNNVQITSNALGDQIILSADEEKLSRAITNILSNCIRYAREVVSITSRIIDNDKVEMTISDDGPGFSADELPHIFERFFKGKKGNFGLGLAISKNVIEKHHGQISAENSASGALFIITMPLI